MAGKKKIKWAFVFVGVVAGLLLWVKITVSSVQISYRIRELEAQVEMERQKQMHLKMERDGLLSLSAIENFSKNQLGLVHAQDKDVILIQTETR